MKKLSAFIICLNLISLTAFSEIKDDFVEKTLDKNLKIPDKKIVVYKENMTPVHVRIKKPFSTKSNLVEEGDTVEFELTETAVIKNKTYPAGTPVKARLETVSMNDIMGVPADVVFGSFNIDGTALGGEITKTGANRTLWVYPCHYGFNIFFALGYAFMPIRGGHAKVKPSETFTLYAE